MKRILLASMLVILFFSSKSFAAAAAGYDEKTLQNIKATLTELERMYFIPVLNTTLGLSIEKAPATPEMHNLQIPRAPLPPKAPTQLPVTTRIPLKPLEPLKPLNGSWANSSDGWAKNFQVK